MSRTRWTQKEDEKLKELFEKGLDDTEIVFILKRSIKSITFRRHKLGLSRPSKFRGPNMLNKIKERQKPLKED
jgi:hypothetical protein